MGCVWVVCGSSSVSCFISASVCSCTGFHACCKVTNSNCWTWIQWNDTSLKSDVRTLLQEFVILWIHSVMMWLESSSLLLLTRQLCGLTDSAVYCSFTHRAQKLLLVSVKHWDWNDVIITEANIQLYLPENCLCSHKNIHLCCYCNHSSKFSFSDTWRMDLKDASSDALSDEFYGVFIWSFVSTGSERKKQERLGKRAPNQVVTWQISIVWPLRRFGCNNLYWQSVTSRTVTAQEHASVETWRQSVQDSRLADRGKHMGPFLTIMFMCF